MRASLTPCGKTSNTTGSSDDSLSFMTVNCNRLGLFLCEVRVKDVPCTTWSEETRLMIVIQQCSMLRGEVWKEVKLTGDYLWYMKEAFANYQLRA